MQQYTTKNDTYKVTLQKSNTCEKADIKKFAFTKQN